MGRRPRLPRQPPRWYRRSRCADTFFFLPLGSPSPLPRVIPSPLAGAIFAEGGSGRREAKLFRFLFEFFRPSKDSNQRASFHFRFLFLSSGSGRSPPGCLHSWLSGREVGTRTPAASFLPAPGGEPASERRRGDFYRGNRDLARFSRRGGV